ncbi:MAG: monovalent cation/H+ antiporter complex subunit F [Proteobacteria bacterium]|nr:monovalent cation/H+ antiporter complex subunit F [Pseudomonadota bacterium]
MMAYLAAILTAAMVLAAVRVVRGPSLADRVVALDLAVAAATGLLIMYSIRFASQIYLDIAISLALVSFVGTVAFARYLERKAQS